jgi:hypothetical protein
MFQNCTSLVSAPNSNVYTTSSVTQANMFTNCTALTTPLRYCAIPTTFGGLGGCPTEANNLTFTGTSSVTPKWSTDGDPLEYKLGDSDWTNAVSGEVIITNDVVKFRGSGRNSLFSSSVEDNRWIIESEDNNVIVDGDFNALLDYEESVIIGENAFSYLLYNNESISTVNATLPSTVLAERCYYSMFRGCSNLLEAPNLPATELIKYCYYYMFYGCTSLTSAPRADKYTKYEPEQGFMFSYCTKLISPIKYSKLFDGWK